MEQLGAPTATDALLLGKFVGAHPALGEPQMRSLMVNRSWSATYWMLISANAHLGRMDVARRYLEQFGKVAPGTTIARIRSGQPAKIPDRIEHILEGMRTAGLPAR